MSAKNDQIILDKIIEQKRQEVAPYLSIDEYFEVFTAEQVTKTYDLSVEELLDGQVGNALDGGIDAMYVLVNGELIQEDSNVSNIKDSIRIHFIITQSKNKTKFEEIVIDKFLAVTEDIFDLSKDLESVSRFYNSKFIEIASRFRRVYEALAANWPELQISFFYATKSDEPTPNMLRKAELLKNKVNSYFQRAKPEFEFVGATKLLDLARQLPKATFSLKLTENAISTEGDTGYICLVKLSDYFDFITDESGKLLRSIFEANVRDYQGGNKVNSQIQQTLHSGTKEDFWWLNNGVTILASKADINRKTLQIGNPEIVNGLQTSFAIYNYFSSVTPPPIDPRNLLIRVIVPNESDSRDRIIRATNSQTPIPDEALRSTDRIHRNIEEYLLDYQIYYDRRKNYYKNQRKPIKKIIGIKQLAQAVMSVALHQPDDARGRPNDLMKDENDYKRLFNETIPLSLYYYCATLSMEIDSLLKSVSLNSKLDQRTRLETKYHLMMYVTVMYTRNLIPIIDQIAKIRVDKIGNDLMINCANRVLHIFEELGATNRVAKGKKFLDAINEDLRAELGRK